MSQYRISGAMFESEYDTGPRFTGFIEIDGKKEYIALWPKVSAKGQNYLQVSENKKKDTKPNRPDPFKPKKPPTEPDDGDLIPF